MAGNEPGAPAGAAVPRPCGDDPLIIASFDDTLREWRARADEALEKVSGRTPAAMVAALEEWPILSAPMAEQITRSSRASVHRALDWLVGEGLAREVTGQGRFRFWAAAVH